MARGMVNINNKRKAVDCVLEVRDARAPLSSANPSILNHYPNNTNKLVILNKADLTPKHSLQVLLLQLHYHILLIYLGFNYHIMVIYISICIVACKLCLEIKRVIGISW